MNKRLNRHNGRQRLGLLHKTLLRFGEPFQYSLFECILTEELFDRMRREVASVVVEPDNSVRYYEMCEACHGQTLTLGQARTTTIKFAYIL